MLHVAADLQELVGCTLACDCEAKVVCEGDPLRARSAGRVGLSNRMRQVLAAVAPTVGAVIPYWSQELVGTAFRSLYPSHYFDGFCFSMVEDLVNQPPFTNCRASMGRAACPDVRNRGCLRGLLTANKQGRFQGRLPALPCPFGLSCDDHFEQSLARAVPLPAEQPPLLDLDLHFAADAMADSHRSLRDVQQSSVRFCGS